MNTGQLCQAPLGSVPLQVLVTAPLESPAPLRLRKGSLWDSKESRHSPSGPRGQTEEDCEVTVLPTSLSPQLHVSFTSI